MRPVVKILQLLAIIILQHCARWCTDIAVTVPPTSKVTTMLTTTHFARGTCICPHIFTHPVVGAETANQWPPNRVLHLVFIPLRRGLGQKHKRDSLFIAHRARFSGNSLLICDRICKREQLVAPGRRPYASYWRVDGAANSIAVFSSWPTFTVLSLPLYLEWNNGGSYSIPENSDRQLSETRLHLRLRAVMFTEL